MYHSGSHTRFSWSQGKLSNRGLVLSGFQSLLRRLSNCLRNMWLISCLLSLIRFVFPVHSYDNSTCNKTRKLKTTCPFPKDVLTSRLNRSGITVMVYEPIHRVCTVLVVQIRFGCKNQYRNIWVDWWLNVENKLVNIQDTLIQIFFRRIHLITPTHSRSLMCSESKSITTSEVHLTDRSNHEAICCINPIRE